MAMMLGEAKAVISLDVSDLISKSTQAQGALMGLEQSTGGITSGFGRLKGAALGFGTALIAPLGIGLKSAVDLEQAIANVNASLGGVDSATLDMLATSFQDIGTASKFSATEVAIVGDELAKMGYAAEVLPSMTQAVVDLSQATGTGLAPATQGITQSMAMWNKEVVGLELAMTDATYAADVLTNAANQSAGGVEDIIAGMRNAGPAMASVGLSFEEASAAIAMFTNYGYSGSEVGTKLSRAIQMLAAPSAKAAAEMDRLGISAFDAQGSFIGFPALFDQLQKQMGHLSDEEQQLALKTIFGAEAFDIMALAIQTGAAPLEEMIGLMGVTGSAAEQSALRMDTLGAQFDTLKEGVTTLLGSLMQGLIPGLRFLVDGANATIDVLMKIPEPIKTIVGAIGGLLAVYAAITRAVQGFQALDMILGGGRVTSGFLGMGLSLRPLLIGFPIIGAAVLALSTNFFGVRDAAIAAANGLANLDIIKTVTSWVTSLSRSWDSFLSTFGIDTGRATKDVEESFKGVTRSVEEADGTTAWYYFETDENGNERKVGKIIDSKEAVGDEPVKVLIETEDGQYWADLNDLQTGETVGTKTITVDADTKDARTGLTRLQDGLIAMQKTLDQRDMPFMSSLVGKVLNGVTALQQLEVHTKGAFKAFREAGMGRVEAGLSAIGVGLLQASRFAGPFGPLMRTVAGGLMEAAPAVGIFTKYWGGAYDAFREEGGVISSALKATGVGLMQASKWAGPLGPMLRKVGSAFLTMPRGMDRVRSGFGELVESSGRLRDAWGRDGIQGVLEQLPTELSRLTSGFRGTLGSIRDWTLDVGVPKITGWIVDAAGDTWDAISTAAGWAWDGLVTLGSWTLETAIPTVAGWISDAADAVWPHLSDAAGWVWDGLVDLGSWALQTAAPAIGGWILTAATNIWDAISTAAGWAWDGIVDLGDWVLDTAVPTVGGWVSSMVDVGAWLVNDYIKPVVGDLADWVMNVAAPTLADWLWDAADLIEENLGTVTAEILDGAWKLVMGEPFIEGDLGEKIDHAIEDLIGYTIIYSIRLVIKVADVGIDWGLEGGLRDFILNKWTFYSLTALIGGALILPVMGVSLPVSLAIIGLGVAFTLVTNQVLDFVDRHPLEILELNIEIADLIFKLKNGWSDFTDWVDGIWEDIQTYWDNFWSFQWLSEISFEWMGIDWPDMPDPPGWLTNPPEWLKALARGDILGAVNAYFGDGSENEGKADDPEWGGSSGDRGPGGVGGGGGGIGRDRSHLGGDWGGGKGMEKTPGIFNAIAAGVAAVNAVLPTANMHFAGLTAQNPKLAEFGGAAQTSFSSAGAAAIAGLMPIGGIASNMANSLIGSVLPAFFGVNTSAQSNFTSMQSTIAGQTLAASLAASSNSLAMSTGVKGNVQGMATDAAAKTSEMNRKVSAETLGMQVASVAKAALMQVQMALHFAKMKSSAETSMSGLLTAVQTKMQTATTAVSTHAGAWPQIIAGHAGAMSGAGLAVGQAAGAGVAQGLLNALPVVISAANAIISAVDSALNKAAQIKSPAKRFNPHGEYSVLGYLEPFFGSFGEHQAQRAAGSLIGALDTQMNRQYSPTRYRPGIIAPTSAHAAPSVTQITHVYSLRPEEYQKLMDQAQRGGAHAARWQQPDEPASHLRPGRRR